MIMRGLVIVFLLPLLFTGCVSISSEKLPVGTKIEIIDSTTETTYFNPYSKDTLDTKLIRQKILQLTIGELHKRSIETVLTPSPGAAKLTYNIAHIRIKKGEFEIGYFASLSAADGRILFDDKDEKDGDGLDEAMEKIARRVARSTDDSFPSPPQKGGYR